VDLVSERLDMAQRYGATTLNAEEYEDLSEVIRDATDGRGPDAVIDAVGLEAHGSPSAEVAQGLTGLLPDALARKLNEKAGVDRMDSLLTAMATVRRGGTVSISGVYGGSADPLPMMQLFDKQIQIRMGQANVKRWIDEIMPLLVDESDPLGTETFATHHVPLTEAPQAYESFQKKEDETVKVLLKP
jgi:threonine dehydrogenase-like Zn-dependent dehydrogenase